MKLRGEWQPFFGGGICQLKVIYGGIPRQINFGGFGLRVETMAHRSPDSIDVRAKSGTMHFDSSCIH